MAHEILTVVETVSNEKGISRDAISDVDPAQWSIGDIRELEVESIDFGRIAAQIAKQVIVQKIREAERALVVDAYAAKVGELIYGEVKKQTKDGFIIDLGDKAEAYLERDQMIPKEILRQKQRVNAILYEVNREGRGAQLLLSRSHPDMLVALMKKEIPEISEEIIEIKAAARQAGVRV